MTLILILSIVIIFAVILVTVLTTSKAYKYEHTIDPLPTEEKKNKTSP